MSRDPEEVWSPDYDSTWEEEEEEKPRGQREPGSRRQPNNCRKWMSRAARDLQNYRHGYVNDKNYQYYSTPPSQTPNLDFYQDKRRFEPDGLFITQLLEKWKKKYEVLERNHSYIQWLFPLREYGMNSCAKPLTNAEIEAMTNDKHVQERFLDAYKLMLDFYGITLENVKTGRVTLSDNWESRFRNLNDHSHNNLRITRILKCLGELGFKHYQAPLVKFFLVETLSNGRLPNVERSVLDYFMFTVKDKRERRKLVHYAWKHCPQKRFIWGPVEKLRAYRPPVEDEHETENCQKGKINEGEINGQLDSCENNPDEEGLKDCIDSLSSENVECQQDSTKPDKKASEECIPLTDRVEGKEESRGKFPDKGPGSCSVAVSDNKGLFSSSPSRSVNGGQLPTEDVVKKSNGEEGNVVALDVSPKHDHKVPSAVEDQEEGKVEEPVFDGTIESNDQNEKLQPDDMHENDKSQMETPRKRKRQNIDCRMEGSSDIGPPQSDGSFGMPKEGEERTDRGEDNFNSKLKKLKLSGQPGSQSNLKVADNPLSMAGGDPQPSTGEYNVNQECRKTECKKAKEEIPKLHELSNLETIEEEEEDRSPSSANGDTK
ncbi:uncharacterized protein ACMZJ9_017557 [Mantella aurantiaca]